MQASTNRRRGFTLVELLVVIAIIATLAALLTPAVMMAIGAAKDAAIKLEVTKIEQGLEDYKNKYGDYPPDFSDPTVVQRHFRKAFPRMAADEQVVLTHILDNETVDRAEALFFALHGFSKDVTHPFTGPGGPLAGTDAATFSSGDELHGSQGMDHSLIEFEEALITWELEDEGGEKHFASTDEGVGGTTHEAFATYLQRGSETPFVYFDSRTYVINSSGTPTVNQYPNPTSSTSSTSTVGFAQPYKTDQPSPKKNPPDAGAWNNLNDAASTDPSTLKWANADKFQIITAGADGKFSALDADLKDARVYPSGIGYKTEDNDNITNFSQSSTLNGDLP